MCLKILDISISCCAAAKKPHFQCIFLKKSIFERNSGIQSWVAWLRFLTVDIPKWKLSNFSAILNLHEINCSWFAILTILEALNFDFLGILHLKMSKIPKNSKFKAGQMVKMAVFGPSTWSKLISHKIWEQKYSEISTFWFPIRLPRSVCTDQETTSFRVIMKHPWDSFFFL